MALEIERKFLVQRGWRPTGAGTAYVQGYLHAGGGGPTVRVRLAGEKAYLTIKGAARGITRQEFEYPVPPEDARELMKLAAGGIVEKTRYRIDHAGRTWEVDVFSGVNSGLVMAEIELASPEDQVELPAWVTREVSDDRRYANAYLAVHPWPEWGRP